MTRLTRRSAIIIPTLASGLLAVDMPRQSAVLLLLVPASASVGRLGLRITQLLA